MSAGNDEPNFRRELRASYELMRPRSAEYVFIPDLSEGDDVVLHLATTAIRFRVIDPIYFDIAPEGLDFLGEHVKIHGAISLAEHKYVPMAILPRMGVRLGMSADPIGAPERPAGIERSWIATSEVFAATVNDTQQFSAGL